MDKGQIESALTTRLFGRNLVYLSRTGSTNDVAKDLAAQGAPEGTVVLADEQTAGRGRMGRHWSAPPGTCLLCSILFRPALLPTQATRLTMLCSLAAADAIQQVAGLHVALKWPNDLIVKLQIADCRPPTHTVQSPSWKKLSGILTETGTVGSGLEFAIVGIGINVNVPQEELPTLAPDATSILAETGRTTDRATLLAALLAGVEQRYEALRAGANPQPEWAARLATLGQPVQVTTPDGVLTGVAESVDEGGALLLRTPDGVLHRLLAGDVTLRHPEGAISPRSSL
jgi:BirA family biotin operon repressor/biotin-[acetyl-CoA-carboxylase] ligase